MKKTFGSALNGVAEPHRRESHIGRISTVGDGGKSIAITNMNNSQLRNLVPIMPYGVSSSPPTGLMSFVLAANNSGRDGIVGVYDPNKPSCSPGNSMLYSSGGATVHCSGSKVLINNKDILQEIDNLFKRIDDLSRRIN
jgi:hypothetical protein